MFAALYMKKVEVDYVDGLATVPAAIIEKGLKRWESFLVGFFVGRWYAFPTVRKHLESNWKLRKSLDIKLDGNLFFIKIESEEERRSIFEAGPIFIFEGIFVIQQWSPDLENQQENDNLPVWAKL